jgi:ribosomal 30S subunit maturation factor RimM
MEYITLGYILKPFGLKGEVRCKSLTSFAKQRFKKGTKLSLHDEKTNETFPATVKSFRDTGGYYFLSLEE